MNLVEMELRSLVSGVKGVIDEALVLANDKTLYENEAFADLAKKLGKLIGAEIVGGDYFNWERKKGE